MRESIIQHLKVHQANKMLKSVILVICLIAHISTLKLPSNFKRCHLNDPKVNECLDVAIRDAIRQMDKPLEEYGIPSLDPYLYNTPVQTGNRTTDLEETYTNLKITGQSSVQSVKTNLDYKNLKLSLEMQFEKLLYDFDFEVHGKMVFYYINTKTHCAVLFNKPVLNFDYKFEEYEKDNQKYLRVIDGDWKIAADKDSVVAKFDKLFPSQKLNDEYNAEISKKWTTLFPAVIEVFGKTFAMEIYGTIFNNILEKVPLSELF